MPSCSGGVGAEICLVQLRQDDEFEGLHGGLGAGVEFVERGSRDLKGFSGPRRLYEARGAHA